MKEIKGLKPFGRFIMTIGQLPASYLVSMTYEEQLIWFCNYLQNTVIPTVNNNAEAVEELQNLFIELKSYVDNYFENLDVQEEINNKLDEMAESGELAELISQYLGLGVLFVYDTASDLGRAENLNEGASAYILGKDSYNDGKGAFYKIRELLNTDVPDGDNIITITNSDNLVGEKLPNYAINSINTTLGTLTNTTIPAIQGDINTINNTTIPAINTEINGIKDDINLINSEKTLFIGDSYGAGTTEESSTITSWIDYMISRYYPGSYKYAINAAGFTAGTTTFLTLLNNAINEIENPEEVKNIVVCGGFNDRNSLPSDITSAIGTFVTTAKQTFTNAKIYIGMIGGCSLQNATGTGYRSNTFLKSLPGYKNCIKHGAIYLNGVEQILKDYSYLSSDGYHPNATGYSELADGINQAMKTGSYSINKFEGFTLDTYLSGNVSRNGETTSIDIEGYVTFSSAATGANITLGNIYGSNLYRLVNGTMCGAIPCRFHWETNQSKYYGGFGYIVVFDDGTVQLQNHLYTNTGDNNAAGIVRISGVTKLVIDYANATFPTNLC